MADAKISALTADAAPQAADYLTTIRSPFGLGSNRKVLLSTLGLPLGIDDLFLPDDKYLKMGNVLATPDAIFGWNTTQTVDAVYLGLSTAQNTFIIAEKGDFAYDFAHGAQTNPTVYIQSATQSATQWGSFTHDQTDFVIASGGGHVKVTPAANSGFNVVATDTRTTGAASYGMLLTKTSSAIVTGTNQNLYGISSSVTKTGLDTSTDTTTLYGVYGSASNTGSGDFGTRITYGGYFTATGDAAGTSTTYGLYATASGADVNYALYTAAGDVTNVLAAGQNVYIDATSAAHTETDGALFIQMTSATNQTKALRVQTTNTALTGTATYYSEYVSMTSSSVVTADSPTFMGSYITCSKTGADTTAGTEDVFGVYVLGSNTGSTDAGTRRTYGGFFSATGDAAGTSTAYGIYADATGADTNWAGYFNGAVRATSLTLAGTITGATTVALSQGITQTTTVTGTLYDMVLETEWTNGTLINADFGGATVQNGDMFGTVFNFNANLAGVTDFDVTGHTVSLPALTQSSANTTTYIGWNLATAGALVQDTLAGIINWYGAKIQMPNITQTTGAVMSYGLYINGGTVTSGTQWAIVVDSGASRFDGAIVGSQGTDIASSANIAIPRDGNTFELTGTTKVELISNIGYQDGMEITLIANENVTIDHATATSGTNITILLAGGADFDMTANDTLKLVLSTTTAGGQAWRELSRTAV